MTQLAGQLDITEERKVTCSEIKTYCGFYLVPECSAGTYDFQKIEEVVKGAKVPSVKGSWRVKLSHFMGVVDGKAPYEGGQRGQNLPVR